MPHRIRVVTRQVTGTRKIYISITKLTPNDDRATNNAGVRRFDIIESNSSSIAALERAPTADLKRAATRLEKELFKSTLSRTTQRVTKRQARKSLQQIKSIIRERAKEEAIKKDLNN